ncbi:hydrophobin 2 [Moniliophthora roreri]|nr:hydrophobin 2 [Moniliophthora roreri]
MVTTAQRSARHDLIFAATMTIAPKRHTCPPTQNHQDSCRIVKPNDIHWQITYVDVDGGAANGNSTICKEKQVSQRIATNTNDRDGVTLDTNGDVQILDNDTREPESLCDVLVLSVIDSLAALDIAGVALGTIVATWGGDNN